MPPTMPLEPLKVCLDIPSRGAEYILIVLNGWFSGMLRVGTPTVPTHVGSGVSVPILTTHVMGTAFHSIRKLMGLLIYPTLLNYSL